MPVDPTQINNTIVGNIYTNYAGKITGGILATVLLAVTAWVVANFAGLTSVNTFTGAQTFTTNPQFTACNGYPFSTGAAPFTCSTTIPGSGLAPGAGAVNGAAPHIATNALLKTYLTSYGAMAIRDGFYSAGDGGGQIYIFNSSNCSLNSGSGDGGSQVPGFGGGCWLASDGGRNPQNVRVYGAKGDGTTDDTTPIQAATNVVSSSGGKVFFPQGYYCVKSGPITTAQPGVVFEGIDRQFTSTLDVCGSDTSLFTLTGQHDIVKNLALVGSRVITTTQSLINLGTGCVECTVEEVYGEFGNEAVNASSGVYGSEVYVRWSKFQNQYGFASLYFENTGGNVFRVKLDQPWPAGTPASKSVAFGSWAAATAYATGAVVKDGNYVLQATVGGTSGATLPVVLPYGHNITDGSVNWQLAGVVGSSAIQCDTGCGSQLDISLTDMSSTYYYGISMTNGFSGAIPSIVTSNSNTFGSLGVAAINLVAGAAFKSENDTFGGIIYTGSSAMNVGSGFAGDAKMINGDVCGAGTGVYIGGGSHTVIIGNGFGGANTAVSVAAGVSNFDISHNQLGGTARCGSGNPSVTGAVIASGASDFYSVVHNNLNGTTTGLIDGGTGTHKSVSPNP